MTNYNERLDELMPCDCKFLKGFAWRKGDPCEGCTNGRLKQAITSLIKELVAEARINENNMYIRELPRHYFPSGPGEPHIPLVQFHERIAELKAEKEEV